MNVSLGIYEKVRGKVLLIGVVYLNNSQLKFAHHRLCELLGFVEKNVLAKVSEYIHKSNTQQTHYA